MCYFRQALAFDEQRVKFLPEYVYSENTEGSQEVWFAGSHSDVYVKCIKTPSHRINNCRFQWRRQSVHKEAVEADLKATSDGGILEGLVTPR